MTRTIDIALPKPHSDIQEAMIRHDGNVAAFCGRRFGKTDGYVQRMFYWMQRRPGLYWWIGLSWRSASLKRAWREVSTIGRQVLGAIGLQERRYINRSRFEITIPGMGEIWFRTADNPSSLAGEGIMGAVIDEFSLMQEPVWTEYLEATLLDYDGWAAFSGVPKGNNWAANLWRGSADWPGWLQVHATTYDNPFIDKDAIDEIKATSSDLIFRQEYMAEIVSDAGILFRRVADAAMATAHDEAKEGSVYVAGVDWGRSNDFTVITLIDITTSEQVYIDRFTRIDYETQLSRFRGMIKRFEPVACIVEDNAMGGPLVERLQSEGYPVVAWHTSRGTKETLIRGLETAFDHDEISILPDQIQIAELQAYEQKQMTGYWRFGAPSGMHDDTVIALALAWHGASRGQTTIEENPFYD